jgi:hypothetical protein
MEQAMTEAIRNIATPNPKNLDLPPLELTTPEAVTAAFKTMAQIRREASREIDRLIALLDRLDAPGEDLEETGDNEETGDEEPSLGSVDNFANQERWSAGHGGHSWETDLEAEQDGSEPSLGATAAHDQTSWGSGCHSDREADEAALEISDVEAAL